MMLPGTTASPPNFFTPRRRPALSRPLREDPPAFLCAISKYYLRISLSFFISGGLLGRALLLRHWRVGHLALGTVHLERRLNVRLGFGRSLGSRSSLLDARLLGFGG